MKARFLPFLPLLFSPLAGCTVDEGPVEVAASGVATEAVESFDISSWDLHPRFVEASSLPDIAPTSGSLRIEGETSKVVKIVIVRDLFPSFYDTPVLVDRASACGERWLYGYARGNSVQLVGWEVSLHDNRANQCVAPEERTVSVEFRTQTPDFYVATSILHLTPRP